MSEKHIHITEDVKQAITKLLNEGENKCEIARRLKVDRKTVRRIEHQKTVDRETNVGNLPNFQRSPERCPECGNKVHLPCLQCRLERLNKGKA